MLPSHNIRNHDKNVKRNSFNKIQIFTTRKNCERTESKMCNTNLNFEKSYLKSILYSQNESDFNRRVAS